MVIWRWERKKKKILMLSFFSSVVPFDVMGLKIRFFEQVCTTVRISFLKVDKLVLVNGTQ